MPGTLVPPWYTTPELRRTDVILSSFLWGFTMSLAIFSATKGFRQTYRSWTRSHRMNAYIVMIWLEWVAGVVVAVVCWLYIMDLIPPSFWYFIGMLILWTIQIQCLTQILANRISLVLYDPERARQLKLGVALVIGIINISVFIIWIPARLQISETWIRANNIWDRIEKCIFLFIDLILNAYFMWLVKIKLVANGMARYKRVYRFNGVLVCLSIALDITIIGIMSLPDDTIYIQAHALAYMMKLNIEMNLAELIGKVIKKSNRRRNGFSISSGWQATLTGEGSSREWKRTATRMFRVSGDQAGGIEAHEDAAQEMKGVSCPTEVYVRRGSGASSTGQIFHCPTCNCAARRCSSHTV